MDYKIDLGSMNRVFAVPTAVVDEHLRLAGSAQLKALLWLLRHAGESCELTELSSAIGLSRADAADALQYWREVGILPGEANKVHEEVPPQQESAPKPEQTAAPAAKPAIAGTPKTVVPQTPKPTAAEVARRIDESRDVEFLLSEAQVRLGRLLSPAETATLVWLHDYNGLPVGVLLMIMEYALSEEKTNMRYIEKVAIGWANEEIDTIEKAEEKLKVIRRSRDCWSRVLMAIGLSYRPASARETQYAARWIDQWSFSSEMVHLAYEVCVDSTGKLSLNYMNKVLERWYKANAKTPQDVQKMTATKPAPANKASSPSFDLDEFERMTSTIE